MTSEGPIDGLGTKMDLWTPVVSSFIAGAATTIGGGVVFLLRGAPNPRHISFFLGFAAGVMIVVSVLDLWLPAAVAAPLKATFWLATGIGGSILASALPLPEPERLLERLFVTGKQAPPVSEIHSPGDCEDARTHPLPYGHGDHAASDAHTTPPLAFGPLARKTVAASGAEATVGSAAAAGVPGPRSPALAGGRSPLRLGAIMLLVLTAHNFPEGISVMAAGVKSPSLGFIVTVAIIVHNIAEGFAVAVPVWAGTGSRWLALGLTALSGLSEPLGALLGGLVLRHWFTGHMEPVVNALLCIVAGIMLTVSAQELLPSALAYSQGDKAFVARSAGCGGLLIFGTLLLL